MTNTMTASATAPDTGTAILGDPWATGYDPGATMEDPRMSPDDPWPRCQGRLACEGAKPMYDPWRLLDIPPLDEPRRRPDDPLVRWVCPNGCLDRRCDRRAVWVFEQRCARYNRPAVAVFYYDQCAEALIAQGEIMRSELERL